MDSLVTKQTGIEQKSSATTPPTFLSRFWSKWFVALQYIIPVYIAVHLAFFVTTCLSFLFILTDFSWQNMRVYRLWEAWHHWDTGHYMSIARQGYDAPWRTAFFPLYPLLERALMLFERNPLLNGLLISNVAGLILLVVLYQLIKEDFDQERALRTVLYLSVFPTAFFFAAGYTESLFLCLTLLSFYHMRHGRWWLAGLFGFFASLTRSAGIFLLLPFYYEYLRQRSFNLKALRLDVIAGAFIAAGIGLFSLYCYMRFHDFLAFSHAQSFWQHKAHSPWHTLQAAFESVANSGGFLSFQALRNLTDLVPDLLILLMIILGFVGPWRMPRRLWAYGIYAVALYFFLHMFPVEGTGLYPLQSVSRYLLEIFPAFIVLAAFGKYRMFNMSYLLISAAILFFLLTQFLTGHWVL